MARLAIWYAICLTAALALGCGDGGGGDDAASDTDADGDTDADSDTDADGDTDADSDADTDTGSDMGAETSVIFLHHSTGANIWGGGVADWIADYDATSGNSYTIEERAYPDSPYPWANYPYDYWYLWVDNAGPDPIEGQDTLEILTAAYDVIVFKHCFPVSDVQADTGSPDVSSSTKSIENYQLQYEALKAKLLSFPDNRFIVWTGAAQVQGATTEAMAERAEQFFEWVRTTWDETGDNIFVWDFWTLETAGGLYLLDEHAASASDSHPNAEFSAEVAPYFGQRVVDVIEGLGDVASITGQ
jgi:hypothetical protein